MSWMKTITFVSLMLSMNFVKITSPMMMVCMMILQTTLVCLMLWMMLNTSWFSMILFLVFMGGLMVLFIYICSLASNEKITLSTSKSEVTLMLSAALAMSTLYMSGELGVQMQNKVAVVKMMSQMNSIIITMAMFFLLFTLIVAVKISDKDSGPIRLTKK